MELRPAARYRGRRARQEGIPCYQTLIVERAGAVSTITLNRPEARHAIDLTMRQELVAALDLEPYSQGLAAASDGHQESLAAFCDKLRARFTGR